MSSTHIPLKLVIIVFQRQITESGREISLMKIINSLQIVNTKEKFLGTFPNNLVVGKKTKLQLNYSTPICSNKSANPTSTHLSKITPNWSNKEANPTRRYHSNINPTIHHSHANNPYQHQFTQSTTRYQPIRK